MSLIFISEYNQTYVLLLLSRINSVYKTIFFEYKIKFHKKCSTHQVKPKEEWLIASTRLFKKKKRNYVTLYELCDWIQAGQLIL